MYVCCDFQEFGDAGDRDFFVLDSYTRAGFPGGTVVKNPPASADDVGSIPGLGRSPGNGNSLQYSCWANLMDRGAWLAIVCGVTESDMTEHAQ